MSWLEFGPEPLVATVRPALRRASVLGLGTAVPAGAVANAVIEDRLGVEDGWIERRTGIQSRRVLADGETLVSLTTEACQRALDDANISAAEIDLVVAATTGSDELLPNLAPMVATALGMGAVAAYDVGAACTGFVAAMAVASGAVESGRASRVLVIGADAMNRWADPDDRVCAALFGDGAGALILGADGIGEVGPMLLHSDGALSELVWLPREEAKLTMDGQGTYRKAVTSMHDATHEAVAAAGLRIEDVDLFVYHQANRRILASLTERLGVSSDRVVDAISQIGNTSAASLPLALSQARRDGSLHSGDCVLLGAAGAGFCWGAGVLTW